MAERIGRLKYLREDRRLRLRHSYLTDAVERELNVAELQMQARQIILSDSAIAHDGEGGKIVLLADDFDRFADLDIEQRENRRAAAADVFCDGSFAGDDIFTFVENGDKHFNRNLMARMTARRQNRVVRLDFPQSVIFDADNFVKSERVLLVTHGRVLSDESHAGMKTGRVDNGVRITVPDDAPDVVLRGSLIVKPEMFRQRKTQEKQLPDLEAAAQEKTGAGLRDADEACHLAPETLRFNAYGQGQ